MYFLILIFYGQFFPHYLHMMITLCFYLFEEIGSSRSSSTMINNSSRNPDWKERKQVRSSSPTIINNLQHSANSVASNLSISSWLHCKLHIIIFSFLVYFKFFQLLFNSSCKLCSSSIIMTQLILLSFAIPAFTIFINQNILYFHLFSYLFPFMSSFKQ